MEETKLCEHCGQEVAKRGWFWVLVEEVDNNKVTFCPARPPEENDGHWGVHEVEEDDE